jgi:hypothetical protein
MMGDSFISAPSFLPLSVSLPSRAFASLAAGWALVTSEHRG